MVIACVLRSGGDFTAEHVQWLERQVPGLVCLSDVPVPGVKTIQLQHDWPGWWSKLEMFGPLLDGDVLMLDLDTVVRQLPVMPNETTVLRDFTRPDIMGSGLMFVTAADRARVWSAWIADPDAHMAANKRWPKLGDQGFLQDHIGGAQKWQDIVGVYSYKVHCADGLPVGASIVCFHGKPRPWQVKADWIPAMPPQKSGDFRDLILAHKGKRICVMGGAPSLAADLETVKADIYISTNAHGAGLVEPDYLLAMDERNSRANVPMGKFLRMFSDAPIISPHTYADIQLVTWPQEPRFVLSGMIGAWAAWAMGAKVVILAGMDGYGGQNGYLSEAQKIDRDIHCPVRVAGGGPLCEVWPAYDPDEKFGRYSPHPAHDTLRNIDGLTTIRVRKRTTIRGREVLGGEEMTVYRNEIARLLKHRMVEEIA